jgi:hypothetical protein
MFIGIVIFEIYDFFYPAIRNEKKNNKPFHVLIYNRCIVLSNAHIRSASINSARFIDT